MLTRPQGPILLPRGGSVHGHGDNGGYRRAYAIVAAGIVIALMVTACSSSSSGGGGVSAAQTRVNNAQKAVTDAFGGRVFDTTITKSIRLEESPAHKESIFSFAPQSSGAYEYYRLCEEVIERV